MLYLKLIISLGDSVLSDELKRLAKVKSTIIALLSKTTSNGASEGEALSAIEKAMSMMAKYSLTENDLVNVSSEPLFYFNVNVGKDLDKYVDSLLSTSISIYTGTMFFEHEKQKLFVGSLIDVTFANYIRNMCLLSIEHEWNSFSKNVSTGFLKKSKKDFVIGMILRIKERLREMKSSEECNANALMIIKRDLIISKLKDTGGSFEKPGSGVSYSSSHAFQNGKLAGDSVQLNMNVEDSGKRKKYAIFDNF